MIKNISGRFSSNLLFIFEQVSFEQTLFEQTKLTPVTYWHLNFAIFAVGSNSTTFMAYVFFVFLFFFKQKMTRKCVTLMLRKKFKRSFSQIFFAQKKLFIFLTQKNFFLVRYFSNLKLCFSLFCFFTSIFIEIWTFGWRSKIQNNPWPVK